MPGLITNSSLEYLYNKVKEGGSLESDTAKLWMAIFNREFPAKHEIYCVQETPPAPQSRQRVDATVYRIIDNSQRNLLYSEFKRSGLEAGQLDLARDQVHKYCLALIQGDGNTRSIMALCCHGTKVSIWNVSQAANNVPPKARFVDAKTGGKHLKQFRAMVKRINPKGR